MKESSLKLNLILIFILSVIICDSIIAQNAANDDHQKATRIILGGGLSLKNDYARGDVDKFFQYLTGDPTALADDGATPFYYLNFGFAPFQDTQGKFWMSINLQYVKTAPHAIWGSYIYFGGGDDIHFDASFINMTISLMFSANQKNNIFLALEPGFDACLMQGGIIQSSYIVKESEANGIGGHAAIGMDYFLSKSINVNLRLGYRFVKADEIHADSNSSTGYSSFYVNGTSDPTLKVDWSGIYLTAGVNIVLSFKHRGW